jgi:hypothetical protein
MKGAMLTKTLAIYKFFSTTSAARAASSSFM